MGELLGCDNTVIEDVDWHQENDGDAGEPALRLIVDAYRFRRQLNYATSAILVSIPYSYSNGVR